MRVGPTNKEVAKVLGLSEQDFSNRKQRGTLLGVVAQWAIERGESLDWLLMGKEPERHSPTPPRLEIQTVPRFKRFAKTFAFEQYIPVRLLKDSVAAGAPAEIRDEDQEGWALIYASREWLPNDPENYTCVHVRGLSMHPILQDGDIVAIDHAEKNPKRLDGKMVAFQVNGGVTIKWLKFKPESETVLGVPENKDELDHVVVLRGEEIDTGIVGKVAWWWAKR